MELPLGAREAASYGIRPAVASDPLSPIFPVPGSRQLGMSRKEMQLVDHPTKFGKRRRVELPHQVAPMNLHRGFGDAHLAGNLLVQATVSSTLHLS